MNEKNHELVIRILKVQSENMSELKPLLLQKSNLKNLDNYEIDLICDALMKEFCDSGLDTNDEPKKYGLEIETAIDWIRKL
jgi:hypothetical protein